MLLQFLLRAARGFHTPTVLLAALAVAGALALRPLPAAAQSNDETPADSDAGADTGADANSGDQDSSQQDSSQQDSGQQDSGQGDPVGDYFTGNTLFVFFHEIGHGLIDKLQLPVLGKEEDAADQLATLILLNAGEDTVGGQPALTAAIGWLDSWNKRESAPDDSDYWDEHSLDMQRYANIVCLVYGSDPDKYQYLVKEWDIPEARADRCPSEFDTASASWVGVTEGAWLPDDQDAPAGNRAFTLEYKPAEHDEYREIAEAVRQEKALAPWVEQLNRKFILPSPIHIVTRECGEENAFYTPENSELTFCYELLAMFLADAQKQAE